MKITNKLAAGLLLLSILFGMIACAKDQTEAPGTSESTSESVRVSETEPEKVTSLTDETTAAPEVPTDAVTTETPETPAVSETETSNVTSAEETTKEPETPDVTVETESPTTEAPTTDVPTTEVPTTETPTTDAPTTEVPTTETPTTEAPTTEAPVTTTPPPVTTAPPPVTTAPPPVTEPPAPETEGRVIFYENFEKYNTTLTSDELLSALGWKADSTANGAYKNNTAEFSLKIKNTSKQLYIKNNVEGNSDCYIIVLTPAQMGKFNEKSFTYQYDLIYDDASAADRYIALVSQYNGDSYTSFHFRNRGSGNNQIHKGGSWYTIDTGSSYSASSTSIITKLLGKTYDANSQALKGYSISIRYAIDYEKGVVVSVRFNTPGYPGSGKWIVVSKSTATAPGMEILGKDPTAAGITLKVGGRQNGYIDNIIIWEGTGDEPKDKSSPLVTSGSGCSGHTFAEAQCGEASKCIYCGAATGAIKEHRYQPVGSTGDQRCTVCQKYKSTVNSGWLLKTVPEYIGGTRASNLYVSGHGCFDSSFSKDDESLMQVIANTTSAQFDTYCSKVEAYGFKKVYSYTQDGNKYAQFEFGEDFLYVYYIEATKEVRVIIDKASEQSVGDFSYSYDKKPGDTTVLYQYGVPMSEKGTGISSNGENKIDCGMMYVLKLPDNSVIIFDGGGYQQFDTAQIDGFMKFLRHATGQATGKIKISAWYITHGHSDHMAGLMLFVKKYHAQLDFDRIMFNFPYVNSEVYDFASAKSNYAKLISYINKYMVDDGVKYVKVHTGQVFEFAGVKFNMMYTHEDIVNPSTGKSEVKVTESGDYNDSCAVAMLEFDGKRFFSLGDINKPAMRILMENYSDASLKCDIIQLAHHMINDLRDLYNVTQAPVVLVPQSPNGCIRTSTRKACFEIVKKYVKNDMLFYASEETTGLQVVDGEIKKVYTAPVDGGAWNGTTKW